MKALLLTALLLAGFLVAAQAQEQADNNYIGIYGMMTQADHLAANGDSHEALAAYKDALKSLQEFQRQYPDWNPVILKFRLGQISGKIAKLEKKISSSLPPGASLEQVAAKARATVEARAAHTNAMENLRRQLQAEQAANANLRAKLKEALSVQPAAVDPRELAKAQEKIRWLMKENDLLKVTHGVAAGGGVATRYVTNIVTVVQTNTQPVVVTNLAAAFAGHARPTVVTNYVRVLVPDTNALAQAREDRATAIRNFKAEQARSDQLAQELEKLRQRVGLMATNSSELEALRSENAALKKQLAVLRSNSAPPMLTNLPAELKQARADLASLKSKLNIAGLERQALQQRLQEFLHSTNPAVRAPAYEARISELKQQRDALRAQLAKAGNIGTNANGSKLSAHVAALTSEVATLKARLAVAEAQPVPFTPAELALFRSKSPQLDNGNADQSSMQDMPSGTANLVASARTHFAHQEFDQAAADYQKILDRDQNNAIALANLAMIELQQNKLTEAEKHIKAALAQSPDDAYNLATLGFLRFRQHKYQAALNALSRAAQIDPNNPETQNYLGLTLSHLGQRRAAEAALRRAVRLDPHYAPANNNLAVLYLSQNPPMPELARWHYEKALADGQPRNPALEKMLAAKGAPVSH